MQVALEDNHLSFWPSARETQDLETSVATASVWLAIAGDNLLGRCWSVPWGWTVPPLTAEEEERYQAGWHVARPERPKFCMDRWNTWSEGFFAVAECEALDETYRAYAAEAAVEMERLKSEHT